MTNIPWLRYGLFVLGLLFTCNGYGQIVSEFRDWEQYAGGNINQGPDGPCEYITRAWAVEYAVRMYYRDSGATHGNPAVDLSAQHIWQRCFERLPEYQNCREPEGITSLCMADFITDHGIVNEACLTAPVVGGISQFDRYLLAEASNQVCIDPCVEASQIDRYRFKAPLEYVYSASQLGIRGNDDLKKAIIKYGPHSLYVQEGGNWPYAFGADNHAILIVGWTSSGKWRFKNSSTQYFDGEGNEESEEESDDSQDGFNNLFSNDEEEENPLANLINSLPDVTVQELLDDLQEIKEILKDWQHA